MEFLSLWIYYNIYTYYLRTKTTTTTTTTTTMTTPIITTGMTHGFSASSSCSEPAISKRSCASLLKYIKFRMVLKHIWHRSLFKHIFFYVCLTLNYHTFDLDFILFTCYINDMFQSKFPFKNNKVLPYLILYRTSNILERYPTWKLLAIYVSSKEVY